MHGVVWKLESAPLGIAFSFLLFPIKLLLLTIARAVRRFKVEINHSLPDAMLYFHAIPNAQKNGKLSTLVKNVLAFIEYLNLIFLLVFVFLRGSSLFSIHFCLL